MISEYDGDDSLVTLFGVDFTASSNPLVAPHADSSSFNKNERVNLKPDGDEIYVDRANRREYVELFTRHALYYCCKTAIDDYLCGLKMVVGDTSVLSLCNSEEMEYIICGSSDIGDISELRQYTSYLGEYHDKHSVIENFWVSFQIDVKFRIVFWVSCAMSLLFFFASWYRWCCKAFRHFSSGAFSISSLQLIEFPLEVFQC